MPPLKQERTSHVGTVRPVRYHSAAALGLNEIGFLLILSVLISDLSSERYRLHEFSFPSGKNMPWFTLFCDCFVTKAVIECAYDSKNLYSEVLTMENKKRKVALNDELLEKVSGGDDVFKTVGSFICPACGCETVDGQCGNPDCVYSIDYLTKHEDWLF